MVDSIHGVPTANCHRRAAAPRTPCISMTTRLLTLLLIPLMAVVVACGSDEELQPASASTDASQLLRDTLAHSANLKSGFLSASLRATGEGTNRVSGPFASEGKGKLPRFAFDVRAGGQHAGLTWTGEKGFITFDNTPYEVSDLIVRQIQAALEQAGSAGSQSGPLAIDVAGWLKNPRNEGLARVGDAQTIKLTGTVDKAKVLAGLESLTKQLGSLGVGGQGLSPQERQKYLDAVKSTSVELYTGASDRILRRLVVDATVKDPDSQKTGRLVADLTLTKVNQDQAIAAPANARPFSELLQKVASGNGGMDRLFGGP
jgi:hypothetical protein